MRRKYAQPALPTLYFKDGILSVPGYTFEKVRAAVQPRRSLADMLIEPRYHLRPLAGGPMGGHRQHDPSRRGDQLARRHERARQDRPRPFQRFDAARARGPYSREDGLVAGLLEHDPPHDRLLHDPEDKRRLRRPAPLPPRPQHPRRREGADVTQVSWSLALPIPLVQPRRHPAALPSCFLSLHHVVSTVPLTVASADASIPAPVAHILATQPRENHLAARRYPSHTVHKDIYGDYSSSILTRSSDPA
ncbi:hypothetical protein NUW54_g10543 [Trametes sanguinea]|uniref:Uncharacterized protein n=1 Tax=Trametes sanguinea TaxID=158606 RepID=A0ACC1NYX8_9APHY|nr:hypothetical protein NUW54_g10543 [Trametes sanguinea]